jgi:hypothetical protein
MEVTDRTKLVQTIGKVLSDKLAGFYGQVQYNIQNGRLQFVTVTETSVPEKQDIPSGIDKYPTM